MDISEVLVHPNAYSIFPIHGCSPGHRGVFRMVEIQQELPIILLISADRRCFIVSQRTTDADIAALPHAQNPQCLQMSPLSRPFFSPPYIQATQTRLPHEFQRQSVIVVSTFPSLHMVIVRVPGMYHISKICMIYFSLLA